MIKVRPIGSRLLVLPIPEPKKSSIYLPVKTEEKLNPNIKGVVIDKGGGTKANPLKEFKNNGREIVFYPRNAGVHIDINGVKHTLIDASEVVGIIQTTENK